jgi:protein-tyrosine-phosphatase
MEKSNSSKVVHFVCTGNIYRSRMAEAYFNHLKVPGLTATSSGIYADSPDSGPISWYSLRIIYNNWFVDGMSRDHKTTTVEMLKQSDFVVFMEDMHLKHCKEVLGYTPEFYQVWNISDLFPSHLSDADIIKISEDTFAKIKINVDKLIKQLR